MASLVAAVRSLFGKREAKQPQQQQSPAPRPRRSITEQVAEIRMSTGVGEFVPAWRQEQDEPAVCAPGPLLATEVTTGEDVLDLSFAMEGNHLIVTGGGVERPLRVLFPCIHAITLSTGKLRLDLHLPLPLPMGGEQRAVRTLFAQVDDASAAARWKWIGAKHFRSAADCPYCFKSAMDIDLVSGAAHPMHDGAPTTTGQCRGCHRKFRYDYEGGDFIETESPDAVG